MKISYHYGMYLLLFNINFSNENNLETNVKKTFSDVINYLLQILIKIATSLIFWIYIIIIFIVYKIIDSIYNFCIFTIFNNIYNKDFTQDQAIKFLLYEKTKPEECIIALDCLLKS